MSSGRSTISPTPTMTGMRSSGTPFMAIASPATTTRPSLLNQPVHVLDRVQKILLELLHHAAGRFHAVDQPDALADEVRDEIPRARIAGGRGMVDRMERVAADDALQRHRQGAGTVGCAVP